MGIKEVEQRISHYLILFEGKALTSSLIMPLLSLLLTGGIYHVLNSNRW